MRWTFVTALIVVASMAGAQVPELANPGFEAAEQWSLGEGASLQEDGARTGQRRLLVRSEGAEVLARQVIEEPGSRPMVLSAWVRSEGLQVDRDFDPQDYAWLYCHVLYKDRPYADTSQFYTPIPTGAQDWQRVAIQVLPRQDLTPSEMWVSLCGRFRQGEFWADDVKLEPVRAVPGAPAMAWERAGDATLITDLSQCTPKTALADKRRRGRWKVLEYETNTHGGKCIAALPNTGAPPVTLPLNTEGWHAVYIGLNSGMAKVKLTGDPAYQWRSHSKGNIDEIFFKHADLTGQSLQLAQQSAGKGVAAAIMHVKLVPLTDAEVARLQADVEQRETKQMVATIDGFSFIFSREPTTKAELLEEFEHYRGTDFGTLWWCIGGADEVNYASELGTINGGDVDDFPREGDASYTRAVKKLIASEIDITEVAVEAARSIGAEIHIGLRPAAWQGTPPYEDFFVSDFYRAHPQWRCVDRDGTPVARMSFAIPEVRAHLLGIFREVLQARPDGLNVLYNRGMPLILWEDAFCEQFQERHGEDAKAVEEDDPRILELRADLMTGWMADIRGLLDEAQRTWGREEPLKLSAMVLETEADNLKFGLDVERWVTEGLIDQIGIYKGSHRTSGDPIDMEYFARIADGTDVTIHPCMVAWALPKPEEMMRQGLDYYDRGADGMLFWDPSGVSRNGGLWPIVSRMGHVE